MRFIMLLLHVDRAAWQQNITVRQDQSFVLRRWIEWGIELPSEIQIDWPNMRATLHCCRSLALKNLSVLNIESWTYVVNTYVAALLQPCSTFALSQ